MLEKNTTSSPSAGLRVTTSVQVSAATWTSNQAPIHGSFNLLPPEGLKLEAESQPEGADHQFCHWEIPLLSPLFPYKRFQHKK